MTKPTREFTRKEKAELKRMVYKLTNDELNLLEDLVRQEVWDRSLRDKSFCRNIKLDD